MGSPQSESPRQGDDLRRLGFQISKIYQRRPQGITPLEPQSTHLTTRACGHVPAPVRNVEPAGSVVYLCPRCFRRELAVEFKAVVRRELSALFRNLCPRLNRAGGSIVDYLLSRAMFAAYRDKSYRLWIALARVVARIAERGVAI